ncbi:MAG: TatD family hydrolase [Candidatus Falkowbacteria bacterium]
MTHNLRLIDTHCHLNFQTYKKDTDQVIRRAFDEKIEMIIPSTDLKSSQQAVKIAEKYDKGVYAAIGLHPVHLQNQEFEEEGKKIKMKGERFDYDVYKKLLESKKVVAIGEVGLDYYHLPKERIKENKQLQQFTLLQQLELAYDLDKSVIVHCREAHEDLFSLLQKFYQNKKRRLNGCGVLHCFSGDWKLAWKYFELNFLISFTGLITFNDQWNDLIRQCPLDKLIIETDSPFMAPIPHRGERNEPTYVKYVADRIAQIKDVSFESVIKATTKNAKKLFQI